MKFAVIFDMDGVIVENGEFHRKAWEEFSRIYDITFSEEKFKNKFFGRTNNQVLPEIFGKKLSAEEVKTLADEKEEIYRKIYASHMEPLQGLVQFLKELKQNKIPVAVATSAPNENVDFVLGGLNIKEYIDAIVTDSMVEKGKPDPEIYLKAAEMLGFNPRFCVVFEDSLSGTKSALDAGAKVVAVTTTLPAEKHRYAQHTVPDFTEVSLEFIEALFDET